MSSDNSKKTEDIIKELNDSLDAAPSVLEFDLNNLLNNCYKGKSILKEYSLKKKLSSKSRALLVDLIITTVFSTVRR